MMADKPVDPNTRKRQSTATDPARSIWVSANAGSGKTYVLSRRVIRLLLEGNKPSELLCLTFTKAAAAEMSNRVFDTLSGWTMMAQEDLGNQIAELTGKPATDALISRARKLFAMALDTPGGLRIQTIHAFCESLLHQFPLEANIPAHFEMLDDIQRQALIDEARRRVILASEGLGTLLGSSGKEPTEQVANRLHSAFYRMRGYASEQAIGKAIDRLISQRDKFEEWIRISGGSADAAMDRIQEHFGFDLDETPDSLRTEIASFSYFDEETIDRLLKALQANGGVTADTLFERFKTLQTEQDPKKIMDLRRETFFTDNGRKSRAYLVSKKFMESHGINEIFQQEQAYLEKGFDRLKTLAVIVASRALFLVADTMLNEYAALKMRRGQLDFNDLISRAANLLSRNEIAAWIQYKLDKGISHVLVDEAQDTSPQQWLIIEAITSEFYSGAGARDTLRTTFVVGDEKQSIYSFQGADPEEFEKQRKALGTKTGNAGLEFNEISLDLSFRSTQEVLSAVDQVFSLPDNQKGLSVSGATASHTSQRLGEKGEVIVWPLELKPPKAEKTDWRIPPGDDSEAKAEIALANRIAQTIHDWLGRGERLPGRRERLRAGDILILVRKRDSFVPAINRALKARNLNSAGADRLKLTTHIAIEDMIALGRFASMQIDDLSLAGLLKSPLFDLSEEEVFQLCISRKDKTLFAHLRALAGNDGVVSISADLNPKLQQALKILDRACHDAQLVPVHAFYAGLFARTGLRSKYLALLGSEVEDVLDGFFQAALDHDDKSGLGLQAFVETLARSEPELKREMDTDSDQIRVITTHSAKGLEAPVVFLVDPGTAAFTSSHAPEIVTVPMGSNTAWLWVAKKADRFKAVEPAFLDVERNAEAEYRRLLYVGMTRAADRLIVCGYRREKPPDYPHWHSMIETALAGEPVDTALNGRLVDCPEYGSDVKKWVIDNAHHKTPDPDQALETGPGKVTVMPKWLAPVAREPAPIKPLSPSGILSLLEIGEPNAGTMDADPAQARERGNAVHHLLQVLPDTSVEYRVAVIERYFEIHRETLPDTLKPEILEMVTGLLDNPNLKGLFGPGSRGEVVLTGKLQIGDRQHLVRGIIDRIQITKDCVLIADFKSSRSVPETLDRVPDEHIAQMALYRALVTELFPDRPVDCQLIWTTNGSVTRLPGSLLDKQMERIRSGYRLMEEGTAAS